MIDVKKFVVAFLTFAILVSGSAVFFLSTKGPSVQPVAPSGTPVGTQADRNVFTPSEGDAGNVFVPQPPADPSNLTDQLATSLTNNLILANPNGPQDAGNGSSILRTPVASNVLADAANSPAYKNLDVPDWNFEAAKKTVRISNDTSDAAVSNYSDALNALIDAHFVKTNLQGTVSSAGVGTQDLPLVTKELTQALDTMTSLSVPSDLVAFHKDFVKLLVYQKNAVALVNDASADPAKASLILQAQNDNYNAAIQSFQTEFEKVTKNKSFTFGRADSKEGSAGVAFVNAIFGIKTANAQWIVFDPTLFAREIWKYVQNVILQLFKNMIITKLQTSILSFVKNAGGGPRIVQNWGGLLAGAFNTAAGSAIGQITPGLCNNFSGSVTGWLRKVYPTAPILGGGTSLGGAAGTNCTLQNSVPNVANYFNDFNSAGFEGFGALASPNNNPYGAFAQAFDQVTAQGEAAETAAQTKAIAASGYKGQERCSDGSDPTGARTICSVGTLSGNQCVNNGEVVGFPIQIPGGQCPDGREPTVTTPGTTIANAVGRNVNSGIDLITNATDITGLFITIATSLINQMVTAGVNGLVGSADPGTGGGTPPQPPDPPVSCLAAPQNASISTPVYFNGVGGDGLNYTWSVPGGNPANGSGPSFQTSFSIRNNYTATIIGTRTTGVQQSAQCTVRVY